MGVTVHRDIQVLIARQHCPAQVAKTVNRAKMEVRRRVVVRWQIADAVVRQGTPGTTVKRRIHARLAKTANHAKTEVWPRGVVPWQIASVTVRLDTQATTVKQQIFARLEGMAKYVNSVALLQDQAH